MEPVERDNISKTSDQKELSRVHPQTKETQIFDHTIKENNLRGPHLDQHRLIRGSPGDQMIKPQNEDWFLHQAFMLSHAKDASPRTRANLEMMALHGYSKVAPIGEKIAENLDIQISPLFSDGECYHRSTRNELLDELRISYAEDMGIGVHEVRIIDSPFLSEVLAREFPPEVLDARSLNIDSLEKFNTLADQLIVIAKQGVFPRNRIIIDMTRLLASSGGTPKNAQDLAKAFEKILMAKLETEFQANPALNKQQIAHDLIRNLHVIGFAQYKGQNVLYLPEFCLEPKPEYSKDCNDLLANKTLSGRHGIFDRLVDHMISHSGFRISPDQAKLAWLKVKNLQTILTKQNIPRVELAINPSRSKILNNCNEIPHLVIFLQFASLSSTPNVPPYLKVLPEATAKLVAGLANIKVKGEGLDQIFARKGLTEMLQTSYFRILNSMNEALHEKNHPMLFNNQMNLIHQEIQNILAVVQPYDRNALATSITQNLRSGPDPIVPKDLEPPRVHLKASAMHGLSSIIASAEAQKKRNNLNVVVLKDSYYESSEVLEHAKTHKVTVLDGDEFNRNGLSTAFRHPPAGKIDLFVCEFHHNISLTRQSYTPENIIDQIKAMHQKGMLSKRCTVAIDTTINLEQSNDFRQLLADPVIHKLIKDGRLNIVFLRSAQKFDMLGMDNYYGGISMTFNRNGKFKDFNARMNAPGDQLEGLNYQGLTHLHAYASQDIELYRTEIMRNTQLLYNKLPREAIYTEGSQNPMQISRIADNKIVFLDIKFPKNPKAADAFRQKLKEFTLAHHIPMTTRASFGFANANFTVIESHKFRLNPGLDNEQTLNAFAEFFNVMQDCIALSRKEGGNYPPNEFDALLASRIQQLKVS